MAWSKRQQEAFTRQSAAKTLDEIKRISTEILIKATELHTLAYGGEEGYKTIFGMLSTISAGGIIHSYELDQMADRLRKLCGEFTFYQVRALCYNCRFENLVMVPYTQIIEEYLPLCCCRMCGAHGLLRSDGLKSLVAAAEQKVVAAMNDDGVGEEWATDIQAAVEIARERESKERENKEREERKKS